MLHCLYHTKIYVKLDIIATFNQLCIQEGDKALTAFRIRFGLFKYAVILFGLYTSLASF